MLMNRVTCFLWGITSVDRSYATLYRVLYTKGCLNEDTLKGPDTLLINHYLKWNGLVRLLPRPPEGQHLDQRRSKY